MLGFRDRQNTGDGPKPWRDIPEIEAKIAAIDKLGQEVVSLLNAEGLPGFQGAHYSFRRDGEYGFVFEHPAT